MPLIDSFASIDGDGINATPVHTQIIYYPTDFVVKPQGALASFYFRAGYGNKSVDTFTNFTLRLGTTDKKVYNVATKPDTFITGLTPVAQIPLLRMTGLDTLGKWVRVLMDNQFIYEAGKNLVVDISYIKPRRPLVHSFEFAMGTVTGVRMISDTLGVLVTKGSPGSNHALNVGFSNYTTGIEAQSGITTFGLFPNPAIDGRFNVSFDARQAIREASVTVTDALGRAVYYKAYNGVGTSFFREVDMSGAARGIYFVRVAAGGALISRQVVVE